MEELEKWLARAILYATAIHYLIIFVKWFWKWLQPDKPKSPKKKRKSRKRKRKNS